MTRVEATKVKVYNSYYHVNALEVFLKAVKDGRAAITRGWPRVMRALRMEEGTVGVKTDGSRVGGLELCV